MNNNNKESEQGTARHGFFSLSFSFPFKAGFHSRN